MTSSRTYKEGYRDQLICGVDVSSMSLEASIGPSGPTGSFANHPDGIDALAAFCRHHQVTLVGHGGHGGYERQAFALLSQQGIGVAILNPRLVRQFATGMGRLEKTDRIDAGIIAWFAEVKRSRPSLLASASQLHVRALVTRLRQLTALRTSQLNQRRLVTEPIVQASFDELLALLKRQIQDLADEIATLIDQDPL